MDNQTKILVVEDDKFLARAYQVKLEKVGFDMRLAGDGEEAIQILHEFKPDVIVLDLVMPRKDGFATLSEIKANPEWKDIPVIISSSLSQKEDIDKGLSMGAKDFIIKSDISLEDLIEKIKSVITSQSV